MITKLRGGSAHFSPDGQFVVTISDEDVDVWNAETGNLDTLLLNNGVVSSAQFSPDGRQVLTAKRDQADLWDVSSGKLLSTLRGIGDFESIKFTPDGNKLVFSVWNAKVKVFDIQSGKNVTRSMPFLMDAAEFSPDGARVLTAFCMDDTGCGSHTVYEVKNGKKLLGPMEAVTRAQFSPDSRKIVTVGRNKDVQVWDIETGKRLTGPIRFASEVFSAQFSPNGQQIVITSGGKNAIIYDVRTAKRLGAPMKHQDPVQSAQFSSDGKWILTQSGNTAYVWRGQVTSKPLSERITLYSLPRGYDYIRSNIRSGSVFELNVSPNGRSIVAGLSKDSALVWDTETFKPATQPIKHNGIVCFAEFSPDGKRIATASEDRTARIWDATTGRPIIDPIEHNNIVLTAKFSPDSRRIVTVSPGALIPSGPGSVEQPGEARVWDAENGKPLTPAMSQGSIRSAEFSPNGKYILTLGDWEARTWDAQSGQPVASLRRGSDDLGISSARFSPDSKLIVAAESNQTRVWDARTGEVVGIPIKTDQLIAGFAEFSPDGKRILTKGTDGAQMWNTDNHRLLIEPIVDAQTARFNSDGKQIVTTCQNATVTLEDVHINAEYAQVWDAELGKPVSDRINSKDLTLAEFTPDGRRIITVAGNKACVWDLWPRDKELPNWFLKLAGAAAGARLSEQGVLEPLQQDSTEVLITIKEQLDREPADNDWTIWGRWFLADRSTRTISPFSKVTIPEYIENRIKENTTESLDEAEELATANRELLRRIKKAREALPAISRH